MGIGEPSLKNKGRNKSNSLTDLNSVQVDRIDFARDLFEPNALLPQTFDSFLGEDVNAIAQDHSGGMAIQNG